ncbi:Lrp/AsnC family transcriptional regulator [Phaeobacter italicus]|uniref:Lrp/AsnC family transcriptional regulator n=1 Tax=Phaeobacter italicus TaxID=481446 RepID=UPI001C9485B5|nr:Lrp/AsnC family transcriptional regulator [Phaeobacter italicus]MBY5978334.1 Lrp/AsnC family transcriptional regulator [Phaeobacter italicus]
MHIYAMAREYSSSRLDAFDQAILKLLQQDCTLPQRQIGEAVNLSTASVQRRIKRMESDGTISAQTAQINPKAVGLPLTIVVEVELRAETSGRIDDIKRIFHEAPEIQQCYYVTGEVDFILIVIVGDMSEYEDLTQRLFFPNDNIRKFRTFVAMDRTKSGMRVNI